MGQIIKRGDRLIRINPSNRQVIEYSIDNGFGWYMLSCISYGEFLDLVDNGTEIIAQTTDGIYFSPNDGLSWMKRSYP